MKDFLTDQLRERFVGHEMDVPPSAWEQVSGQLAASASGESLRNALQEKFRGHEVEVGPSAWANISGKLAQGTGSGSSFHTGWIAAGVAAVALTAGLLLWNGEAKPGPIAPKSTPATMTTTAPAEKKPPVVAALPEPAAPATPEQPAKAVTEQPAPSTSRPQQQVAVPEAPAKPKQEKAPISVAEATAVTTNAPSKEAANSAVKPNGPVTKAPTTAPESEPSQQPKPETDAHYQAPNDNPPKATAPEAEIEKDPLVLGSGPEEEVTDLLIPTAFSPNGDGINDEWKVVTSRDVKVEIRIYALNGTLVFRANDLRQSWDGRMPDGALAENGNYTCLVKLFQPDGHTVLRKGQIHLFR